MNLAQSIILANTAGDAPLTEGIVTLVVGMTVVLVTLIVLVLILQTSGKFFESLEVKDQKKVAVPQVNPTATEVVEEEVDDLELIAVITAAIAASMGTTSDNLQVRSIRKTNNAWSKLGRIGRLSN